MNNYNDFPITEVAKDELYKIMEQKYNDGYRLAQILSVAYEGYNEVIYSVAKEYEMENYKINLPIDEEIKSFSDIFPAAALYENERKYSTRTLVAAFLLFFCGILLNYYAIFPLSFRFLGTYQVSEIVENKITLSSYISTFTMLSIAMGAVFEIPILAYFMAKIGLINSGHLKKYRRHAFVIILIIAAIITPADLFSMFLLAIPMYMLYELSIVVVNKAIKAKKRKLTE